MERVRCNYNLLYSRNSPVITADLSISHSTRRQYRPLRTRLESRLSSKIFCRIAIRTITRTTLNPRSNIGKPRVSQGSPGFRKRMCNPLIVTDGTGEYNAFLGVKSSAFESGEETTFCNHPCRTILKPWPSAPRRSDLGIRRSSVNSSFESFARPPIL
jgi:hypothetical protein